MQIGTELCKSNTHTSLYFPIFCMFLSSAQKLQLETVVKSCLRNPKNKETFSFFHLVPERITLDIPE